MRKGGEWVEGRRGRIARGWTGGKRRDFLFVSINFEAVAPPTACRQNRGSSTFDNLVANYRKP